MELIYSVAVASLFGALVIVYSTRRMAAAEGQWLRRMLITALVLRLFAACVFAALPETRIFHEDADGYEEYGMRLAVYWHGRGPSYAPLVDQNYGYRYVTAAIYYLFGQFRPLASCFNCVVGVLTITIVYRMARLFFHRLVAQRAALLLSIIPSMILWSAVAMKDSLVTLFIVLSLYYCVLIKRQFTVLRMLGLAACLVAVQPLRFYMLYFLGFAVIISLFMETGVGLVAGVYRQLLIIAVFMAMLALAGIAGRAGQGVEFLTFEHVSKFRHGMATTANSGFDADVDVSTPTSALMFLPIGLAELLLGPFPWQFGSMRALFAAPETIYWWLLFPSLIRGFWWMIRKRFGAISPLIIFAATLSCAYSLVHGNVGSGFRQRAQIFVILFIFAALGSYRQRCRRAGLDPDLLLVDNTIAPPAPPPAVAVRGAA